MERRILALDKPNHNHDKHNHNFDNTEQYEDPTAYEVSKSGRIVVQQLLNSCSGSRGSGMCGNHSTEFGTTLANFHQHWPESKQSLADFAEIWPEFGQMWATREAE